MFAFLKRLLGGPVAPFEFPDAWEGSGNSYVAMYRDNIERVADALSHGKRYFRTRYNTTTRCAEVYDVIGGGVVFQIVVHGDAGIPYRIVVKAVSLTPEQLCAIQRHLPDAEYASVELTVEAA